VGPWDVEFLESCRATYQGKIERFLCHEFEKAFREWAEAVAAPQFGERVQQSRNSEHAERFTDMVLDFEGERDRRIEEYRRLIDRIDDVLEGRAGEFMTGSAALRWVMNEKSPSG
jgi:O-acetyl-ADP-ribose deacetylase (regulator of RNase III)